MSEAMFEFGKNAPYIWAAYGISLTIIALLVLMALRGPRP